MRWGCQNPPEPSLVVPGEKLDAIKWSSALGKAFLSLTAEEVPTMPAPKTAIFIFFYLLSFQQDNNATTLQRLHLVCLE